MSIPNVWRDRRSKGLARALNNINLARLVGNITSEGLVDCTVDGRRHLLAVYSSVNPGGHYINLSVDIVDRLRRARLANPAHVTVALLALWRQRDANADDRTLNRWMIPVDSVLEMDRLIRDSAHPDKRNVAIPRQTRQWKQTGGTVTLDVGQFDVSWHDLNDEEMQHIGDGVRELIPVLRPEGDTEEDSPMHPQRDDDDAPRPWIGSNRIYFGPPGSGKSFRAAKDLAEVGINPERVTFHPEYSHVDFIGAYRPVMAYFCNGEQYKVSGDKLPGRPAVVYQFVPGPFARVLHRALRDPEHHHCLLIEEINRGNCAAIFGDVFQLLDRDSQKGEWPASSRYPVRMQQELEEFLISDLADGPNLDAQHRQRLGSGGTYLPANLSIFATMNTSDQSLFPMDAAFKRRWDMRYVPIDYADDKRLVVVTTNGVRVRWSRFLGEVNRHIAGVLRSDDKQLGQWFINADEISAEVFQNKVLSYLWADVFRDQHVLFAEGIDTYDELVKRFQEGDWVFNDEFAKKLKIDGEVLASPAQAGSNDVAGTV